MSKQLVFKEEAREKIINGVNIVADAVITTLGPKGRNVALESKFGAPKIIHDGVSVAKEIVLKDSFENMGAELIKQAASKTNKDSGDGTTTATLLTRELVVNGMKYVTAGTNPIIMKRGIDKAVEIVISEIKRVSSKVEQADWEKVATISAQNNKIGKKVAEAYSLIGDGGIVEVEEGKSGDIVVEHKKGMVFNRGYASPLFARGTKDGIVEIKNPFIMVIDRKLNNMKDLAVFLDEFIKVSKDLVIIADDIDLEVLSNLIVNKLRASLNVVVVNAPGFGDRKKDTILDIAIVTGATLISDESGIEVREIKGLHLGQADVVRVSKDETSIVGGKGTQVAERVELITNQIKNEKDEFEIKKLKERRSKLSEGVVSIQVGAPTEAEMKDLIERVVDAKEATKAAIEGGIIPGGGIVLLNAARKLNDLTPESDDELMGIRLVQKVLEMPIRILAENSGYDAGWVAQNVKNNTSENFGMNVNTGEFGDLVEMGVIEPALVSISALKNAASIASMILTTECLIAEESEE